METCIKQFFERYGRRPFLLAPIVALGALVVVFLLVVAEALFARSAVMAATLSAVGLFFLALAIAAAILAVAMGVEHFRYSYRERQKERLFDRHAEPIPPIGCVMAYEEGMTVGELIERLQNEPLSAPVFVMRQSAPLEVPAVIPIDDVVPAVVRSIPVGRYTYLADRASGRYAGQQNAVILAFEYTLPPALKPCESEA